MKFIEKYMNTKPIVEENDGIIRGKMRPCIVCGDLTEFIEFHYERNICSEECLRKIDDELAECLRKMDEFCGG